MNYGRTDGQWHGRTTRKRRLKNVPGWPLSAVNLLVSSVLLRTLMLRSRACCRLVSPSLYSCFSIDTAACNTTQRYYVTIKHYNTITSNYHYSRFLFKLHTFWQLLRGRPSQQWYNFGSAARFSWGKCPSCCLTNSVKELKEYSVTSKWIFCYCQKRWQAKIIMKLLMLLLPFSVVYLSHYCELTHKEKFLGLQFSAVGFL